MRYVEGPLLLQAKDVSYNVQPSPFAMLKRQRKMECKIFGVGEMDIDLAGINLFRVRGSSSLIVCCWGVSY
jgi:hypothetical protein